jgi:hypothetical protein
MFSCGNAEKEKLLISLVKILSLYHVNKEQKIVYKENYDLIHEMISGNKQIFLLDVLFAHDNHSKKDLKIIITDNLRDS